MLYRKKKCSDEIIIVSFQRIDDLSIHTDDTAWKTKYRKKNMQIRQLFYLFIFRTRPNGFLQNRFMLRSTRLFSKHFRFYIYAF